MNPSRLFIQRPIATLLLMAAFLCTGLFSYRELSVSALPEVDYPTIQVTAQYPGAGPNVVQTNITAPLERYLGEMAGLSQMYSNSTGGASTITLTFGLNTSLDEDEQEVQEAINSANNLLPSDLPDPPTYKRINPADPPVMTLAVTSDELPLTEVQDLVNNRVMLKLSQISGVGLVTLSGGHKPAVQIRANPDALAEYHLTLEDIYNVINEQNVNGSKGGFDGPNHSISIDANDQLESADEYSRLILTYHDGKAITLGDVATLARAPENSYQGANANGSPAIIVSIQRQPGANVIDVVNSVKALLPSLKASLPAAVNVKVLSDRTQTIRASISDVQFEMLLSVALVVMVCFIFLRRLSSTLIPSVAVPLSLVGTFGVMYLAGFSLNNLTLMALTIATGFVIDDAIVVVENIQRRMEEGEPPMQAALNGSQQIGFTIISLTLSLIAVLIPLLFMGDIVGRLFREFAITLAVSILVSMVVSLTLTPMLCAYLLTNVKESSKGRLAQWADHQFERLVQFYDKGLIWVLDHQRITLLAATLTVLVTALLYVTIPKGFFPNQDIGLISGTTIAPQGISFEEMGKRQQMIAQMIQKDPNVSAVSSIIGVDGVNYAPNIGRLQIELKPFSQRTESAEEVIQHLRQEAASIPGIALYMTAGQDLSVDTLNTPSQYQLTLDSTDRSTLNEWAPKLAAALARQSELRGVVSNLQNQAPVTYIRINRQLAARYGITASDIDTALYNAYGQRLISTIYTQSNQYRVVLAVAPQYRVSPADLDHLYLAGSNPDNGTVSGLSSSSSSSSSSTSTSSSSSSSGSSSSGSSSSSSSSSSTTNTPMVRLSSVASIEQRLGYQNYARLDQLPAVQMSFDIASGYSLQQARDAVSRAEGEIHMPQSVTLHFQGAAAAFYHANSNTPLLIIAALLVMYVVLGVLYESFIHPLTILSTLPSAGIGAFLALMLTGTDFDLIALIGIILLIGIVKKNAIMLIDFALEGERERGLDARTSIHQACLLRFRPILMTTMAAMLGALPLMLAQGAGAELRTPLGLSIVGGLICSQLLTLFTTPVIYLFFDRWSQRLRRWIGPSEASPSEKG